MARQRCHPYYQSMAAYWSFLRASFLGGEEWERQGETFALSVIEESADGLHHVSAIEENQLRRYPRESNDEYAARRRMACYHNFCEPFVKTQARAILRGASGPEFPTELDIFNRDVDRHGTSLAAFRDAIISWSIVYGHVYVLVDRPQSELPAGQLSLAQEADAGLRTYLQIVSPLDLLDWSWDAGAQAFEWCKIRVHRPCKRTPDGKQVAAGEYTVLITPDEWIELEEDKPIGPARPGLGFVPLVPVYADRDPLQAEPVGVSLIRDVAYLARSAYNKLSWLTEEEAAHCFSQLVLNTPDKISRDEKRVMGVSRYITVQGGAQYLAPDVAPMQHLLVSMQADVDRAKSMLGVESSPEGPCGGETATSLVLRREGMDAILSGLARRFESAERAIWNVVARVDGLEWQPDVTYASDFTSLSRAQRVDSLLLAVKDGGFDGMAKAELQKEILQGLLPDIPEERLKEILADIDRVVEEQAAKQAEMEAKQAEMLANGGPGAAPDAEGNPAPPAAKGGNPFGGGLFGK